MAVFHAVFKEGGVDVFVLMQRDGLLLAVAGDSHAKEEGTLSP